MKDDQALIEFGAFGVKVHLFGFNASICFWSKAFTCVFGVSYLFKGEMVPASTLLIHFGPATIAIARCITCSSSSQ